MLDIDLEKQGITFEAGFLDERGFNFKLTAETANGVNLLSKLARGSLRPVDANGAIYDGHGYVWFTIPMAKELPHDLEFSNEPKKRR